MAWGCMILFKVKSLLQKKCSVIYWALFPKAERPKLMSTKYSKTPNNALFGIQNLRHYLKRHYLGLLLFNKQDRSSIKCHLLAYFHHQNEYIQISKRDAWHWLYTRDDQSIAMKLQSNSSEWTKILVHEGKMPFQKFSM